MALKATKADVWVVTLEDRPGGAAGKLEAPEIVNGAVIDVTDGSFLR